MPWGPRTDDPMRRLNLPPGGPNLGAGKENATVGPGQPITATMQGPPNRVGIIGIQVVTVDGVVTVPHQTTGIIELVAGSGIYAADFLAPVTPGQYAIVWDDGVGDFGSEDMVVSATITPITPVPSGSDETQPCQLWVTGADILAVCPAAVGISSTALDVFAAAASECLYRMSGRQFPGICERTVRPCRNSCGCDWRIMAWYNNISSLGSLGWNNGYWWGAGGNTCGCGVLSRVKLPGYPVRSITSVSIDGVAVDPQFYRLDNRRYLSAVRRGTTYTAWPVCQDMSLPDEAGLGVFLVTYEWGAAPPIMGVEAALELGCQLGMSILDQDSCTLPPGTVQVQRQGVTINRSAMSAYIEGQTTGLQNVDAFLATYNPHRLARRAAVYSPDVQRFARRQGT